MTEQFKVVIVAKTRMGSRACVGALSFDGHSLRLRAADETYNDHANQEYAVGDVWEITGYPLQDRPAPHVEDFRVVEKRRLPKLANITAFIVEQMPPLEGSAATLFKNTLRRGHNNALYITQPNVPTHSTTFWIASEPLIRITDGKRIRYQCNFGSFVFVGYQEPIAQIAAGTLLRISLAHWWSPKDRPEQEARCYAQVSGWFEGVDAERLERPRRAAVANMIDATAKLRDVFGYADFRPMQRQIIENVLARRDSLIVLPTGGGKSLCYQLPALLFAGVTVVISPLIALMEDQVMQLRALNVAAAALNSTIDYPIYVETMQQVRAGNIKLLYVAPETLLRPEILLLLAESQVACIAIDEAHCISSWGHDFRPDYRQLAPLRSRFQAAVWLALTATATKRVQVDIRETLNFATQDCFVGSFDRPNLFIRVARKRNTFAQLITVIDKHPNQSGIIYCGTRNDVDQLSAKLNREGYRTLPYHAGLDDKTRHANQRAFVHDDHKC